MTPTRATTQSDDQNDGTADPDGSVQQDGDTGAGE
jgi:hypothetical protein